MMVMWVMRASEMEMVLGDNFKLFQPVGGC